MPGRVIVVGSVNVDLVVVAPRLPGPGETVSGGDIARHDGGKGGNQAVAAARLGAPVAFVGAVGEDDFGVVARAALVAEGIDVTHLAVAARPTGVALIVVDARAENLIAVAPGANASPTAASVAAALEALVVGPGDVVLTSREIPPDAVRAALTGARAAGAVAVLNPAPADGLDAATIALADVLTPNETELALLAAAVDADSDRAAAEAPAPTGPRAADLEAIARRLLAGGPGDRAVVVTLGAAGALVVPVDGPAARIPAVRVEPLDTTGAGDAFNGALAVGLAAGLPLAEAVRRAVAAAGLSTTRPGARGGMPTTGELAALLGECRMPPVDFGRFEVLSFDCYGTLIDWEAGIGAGLRRVLDAHGVAVGDEDLLERFARHEAAAETGPYVPYREVLARSLRGVCAELEVEPREAEAAAFGASVADWPAFPDSPDALASLARRFRLAVITNCDDDLFAASNRRLGVTFDWVITAGQVGSYKPSERNFEVALARIGVPRERILHVAQSLFHDHVPAKRLGMATVWVDRRHDRPGGGATPPASATPDLTVPDMATLARLATGTEPQGS